VNGVVEPLEPTTGALMWGSDPNTAFQICSGTLIGCETFLTAAHCVCSTNGAQCNGSGSPNPADYSIFLQHAGFFSVASIHIRSDYNFPVADIAVLKLAAPVTGIAATPINTTGTPAPGTAGRIVGFGVSEGAESDGGIKRSGDVVTASCTTESNITSVCWDFVPPVGARGEDSNTCFGDSGGPLFVDFGGGPVVAGVTSGGNNGLCLAPDNSYESNVFHYSGWIGSVAGADLGSTACSDLLNVGDPEVRVSGFSGSLASSITQATHGFVVPQGTTELRVTLNGVDDGQSNYDLFVKSGNPPTTSDFDCARTGAGQFGLCEFPDPMPGDWFVLVDRSRGSGPYQATATAFTTACSDPANAGQPCDDGNACTENDTCLVGLCLGQDVVNGTPCEDGSACTRGDTCQVGVCTPGQAPLTSCRRPILPKKSRVVLIDRSPDRRDRLVWKWGTGAATTTADLGNPLATTDYVLCIYDGVSSTPILRSETVVPAGSNWQPIAGGYKYLDRGLANDGVQKVILKEGIDGRARIVVRAKGDHLDAPALPLLDSAVLVQLFNDDVCWEAEYSVFQDNDTERFRALSD
jgi:hypothetical protein